MSFIGNWEICYSGFNFYLLQKEIKKIRIIIAIKKNLVNKIIIDHKIDLVNYLYFILLEIWELYPQSKSFERKTRVINKYDNWVRKSYI